MDRKIEKTKTQRLKKYWPYIAGGSVLMAMLLWVIFGNHASTLRVSRDELTISDVQHAEFKDYVRTNGQVLPIQVVQISPEEGGIVVEKVVEEGTMVHRGDVIVRLSNSNLDLQILNAEAELAEKQNLLRNTQVAMQQDRLNNQTEQAQLDMDTQRKQRTFDQNKRLYEAKLISEEDYLQSQEDYQLSVKKQSLVSRRLKQDSLYRTVQMDQMEDNLQNMRRNVVLVRQRKEKLEVIISTVCARGCLPPLRGVTSSISCRCARSIPRCARASFAAISSSRVSVLRTSVRARPTTSTSSSVSPSWPSSSPVAPSSRPRAASGSSSSTRVGSGPIAALSA